MNRRSLAYDLQKALQIDVAVAHNIIACFFHGITVGIARGEPVRIEGFGVFESWFRSPHMRVMYDTARAKPIGPKAIPDQIVIRFTPDRMLDE